MSRVLPFVLIFAVGGMLGMVATRAMLDVDAPLEEEQVTPPTPETPEETRTEAGDLDDPGSPAPSAATDLEGAALLAKALATIDAPEVGDRGGEITGTVLTVDGSPVPAAEVTAAPSGQRPDRAKDESLEGKVRNYVQDLHWRESMEGETTTTDDGSYRITGLADHKFRLRAKADGFRVRGPGRGTTEASPGESVDFIATPIAQLDITVIRADGTEPDQARIRIQRNRGSHGHTWTPEKRTIDLDPGRVTVVASAGENERSEEVEAAPELGSGPVPLTLQLRPRGMIRGQVVFSAEEIDSSATVFLLPATLKSNPTPEDLLAGQEQSWIQPGETFKFPDLDPGSYWIGVARGHRHQGELPTVESVDVTTDIAEVSLTLPPLSTQEGIIVYAYDPKGNALPQISLSFGFVSNSGSRWGGGRSIRMRDGGVLLTPDEDMRQAIEDTPGGQIYVSANHDAFGEQRLPIDQVSGSIELRFQDPAQAVVTVAGYVGSEYIGNISVNLIPDTGDEASGFSSHRSSSNGQPDANGEVKLGPLEPGPYLLTLGYNEQRGRSWSASELSRLPVTLTSGEQRFTVSIPPLYSLEVIFPEEVTSGSANLSPSDPQPGTGSSMHTQISGGTAVFSGLVAGRYRLNAWGEGVKRGQVVVEVPASGPVYYEPVPINAIRVRISDPEGPLATAGFQDDDVIVRINGQPFEGEEQLALLGVFLQGAEVVQLTVERGGREIDLEIDPRGLMGGNPGGNFQPTVR